MGSGPAGRHTPDYRAALPGVLFRERREHSRARAHRKTGFRSGVANRQPIRGVHETILARQHRQRAAWCRRGYCIAVHYSIMLGLAAVSFWIVRAQGLVYGYFNFLNIARYPDVIFPWLFRLIFGWVIPVVIIANIPARLLIKSLGQPFPLMLHLIIASTIVFWLSRVFWKFALRHYSSASS